MMIPKDLRYDWRRKKNQLVTPEKQENDRHDGKGEDRDHQALRGTRKMPISFQRSLTWSTLRHDRPSPILTTKKEILQTLKPFE